MSAVILAAPRRAGHAATMSAVILQARGRVERPYGPPLAWLMPREKLSAAAEDEGSERRGQSKKCAVLAQTPNRASCSDSE